MKELTINMRQMGRAKNSQCGYSVIPLLCLCDLEDQCLCHRLCSAVREAECLDFCFLFSFLPIPPVPLSPFPHVHPVLFQSILQI